MTARNTSRTNTQTEQNKEDNSLLLYRLEKVEDAVKGVDSKISNLNSPNKTDFVELRDTLLNRINEIRDSIIKKVDDNERDSKEALALKADKSQVDDLKTRVNAYGAAITSVIVALAIFFFTKLANQ